MMVFMAGATGFIGSHVLREVIERGHRVRCLVRAGSERKLDLQPDQPVEIVNGDIMTIPSLEGGMNGCDAVMNMAGIIREFPARGVTYERLHVEGVKNLVEAARGKGIKRFVHISALGSRPDAPSAYHRTKAAAEEILRESGLDYTLFRPSVVFGRNDQSVNLFADMIRRFPVFLMPGNGKSRLQPVAVESLASAAAASLEMGESLGRTYDVGGPDRLTYNELLDAIGEAIGRRVRKAHIPMGIMMSMARLFESNPRFPATRDQLLMLKEDNICDPVPFHRDFNLTPIRFRDGISAYLG